MRLRVAVLAGAVVCLAGAGWVLWYRLSGTFVPYTGSHPRLRFQDALVQHAAEPLIAAGLLGLLLWLLLGAIAAGQEEAATASAD